MKEGMTPQYALSVGHGYGVIQVDIFLDKSEDECIYFRVVDDEGMVNYVPIVLCSIRPEEVYLNGEVQIELPEGWVVQENEDGSKSFLPIEFSKKKYKARYSFWEDFYDSEGEAENVVGKVLQKLYPEEYKKYRNNAA